MGIYSAGSLLLCDFPWRRPDGASANSNLAFSLAFVPHHVRRRIDQAARRSLLARSHVPELLLRDPAHAQSAELVFSLGSAVGEQGRRVVQSLLRIDSAVRLLPAATDCRNGRSHHDSI